MKTNAFQKTYQTDCVLSFPEFCFQPGRIYALIGANGSGKSTFAKILSGTLPSDRGVRPFSDAEPSIGYLPQKPYAFRMTLKRNLLLNSSAPKKEAERCADALMNRLDLTSLAGKKASTLSGGETARMCLARLFMKEYELLILDEPCAAMDISSTLQTEKLITEYTARTGAAVILITHSLAQARRLCDEVLFFHEGVLAESGECDQILSHPVQEETRRFLEFFS